MEKSSFVKVLGESPIIKVLDFLLTARGLYDYSLTEIAENSEISWATLHKIFPKLEKMGIVKKTREIARAKLYMLNEENQLVKELIEMDKRISDYFVEKELEKQKIGAKVRA